MEHEQNEEHAKKENIEVVRENKNKTKERKILLGKIKAWMPWVVLLAVIVGGMYWATTAAEKAQLNRPGEEINDLGVAHINATDDHDPYNSNPATSGPHAGPAPMGFSEVELLEENAIHNLEHGGIWITYKDLTDDEVDSLRTIAKQYPLSVVISPRPENDARVTLSSWNRRQEIDGVDEKAIVTYIRKNRNKSPEPLAR